MMDLVANEASPNSVLIIEDDFSQLKTLADIIESEGYRPICCQTDEEAFDAIEKQEHQEWPNKGCTHIRE